MNNSNLITEPPVEAVQQRNCSSLSYISPAGPPSKQQELTQCCLNVGPVPWAVKTLKQHLVKSSCLLGCYSSDKLSRIWKHLGETSVTTVNRQVFNGEDKELNIYI